MEEKRKLEKLLFADIEKASRELSASFYPKENAIKERILKNPPKEVVSAFGGFIIAKNAEKNAEKICEKYGFEIASHYSSEKPTLRLKGGSYPKELQSFSQSLDDKKKALEELKRSYTIKLFAGGEVATELFKNLAKELASILK